MAKNTEKDRARAAELRNRGIYHGRRMTTSTAPPVPPVSETGSAAYRRLMRSKSSR